MYFSRSDSRILSLGQQLGHLDKGTTPMIDYLNHVKSISDALNAADAPASNIELILSTLDGLPDEYENFVTSITT
ncbi:hypothetical protein GIB67_007860 [Kingdonia uniflora]|uniref:Uncharacterized protein n=1 Tax=Kingdonia uniflora TaxID=39325 RepID=A0A7J7MLA0_9MAGN|nr:hypothetical protein GIB67_007860 [Kingdonia uniflora]